MKTTGFPKVFFHGFYELMMKANPQKIAKEWLQKLTESVSDLRNEFAPKNDHKIIPK